MTKDRLYDLRISNYFTDNRFDSVFLLSLTDIDRYFTTNGERACKPTRYAITNGANIGFNGNSGWWLRSPGYTGCFTAFIRSHVGVRDLGADVYYKKRAIRPAICIESLGVLL